MKYIKKVLSLTMAMFIAFSFCITSNAENSNNKDVTILFTHDLHSHLLPTNEDDGGQYGGYARLMTAINEQKEIAPDAILVDGGDFSMGSLFQTAFKTSALELRMMGKMGYDATTFGNHEYDYLPEGLASMLNVASSCGERVPAIVEANYLPPEKSEDGYNAEINDALNSYGVKDYIILERGGIYYVIFGIFGKDSHACAPNSGMILHDPAQKAQQVVDKATKECVDTYGIEPIVVCLSHSGTENGKGEDYELAENVQGIDVIVSGHTHTTLEESIKVNDTYIVSAGEYGKYLGVVNLNQNGDGSTELVEYKLIPIDEKVKKDKKIAKLVESYKKDVEKNYLSDYDLTFDKTLINNDIQFEKVWELRETLHESTLGNLYSDAYKWAVEKATGKEIDVALTAVGVIRESLPTGKVSVSDVFNSASLGVGTEGELVSVYVTGKDLRNALEVDASVQPLMSAAQLYFSGVEYSLNTCRMIFNKVNYSRLRRSDGSLEKIDDDKLYNIVTGMYCGQMLGTVKDTSMGLISIIPRDKDGNPIEISDLVNYVVKDEDGTTVKEWYAISSYLQQMGGEMDSKYAETDGRKVIYSSLNPVKLLSNANVFTYVMLAVILVLILVITLVVRFTIRRIKKILKKKRGKEIETKDKT